MKLKLYPLPGVILLMCLTFCRITPAFSQNCNGLSATYIANESRCTATGSVQINATGGSGTFNYKVQGTVSTDFTSSNIITGLGPGTYSIIVRDVVSNCTFQIDNVVINGSYANPRFGLSETDVTCVNGNDGTIFINGLQNGRAPFTYTIVAPSPAGVGTSNLTGTFTGLIPGSYYVKMVDSCGGVQTRNISVQNYNWSITSSSVTQTNCTMYQASLGLTDSKGNTNSSGTAFDGFQYGIVNAVGDTSWFSTSSFAFDLGQRRGVTLVVKDRCGYVQSKNWSNNTRPGVGANVTINGQNCTSFNATITGQVNLTNPQYCLVDGSGNPVPGQPCNTTGAFTGIPYGSYCIQVTNSCYDTVITRCFSQVKTAVSISPSVNISNYTCTTVTATVTGAQHFINPIYCLYDGSNNQVGACNNNGVFNNVPYGTYKVTVTEGCDNTFLNTWITLAKKTKSVSNNVTINGYGCGTFNATVGGATNLTSPQYCLVDNLGNTVACNSTGVFNNIAYGSYCINVTDACGDTTIQRCINVTNPTPGMGTPAISNQTCSGFTVTATNPSNIFNGLYCLQDGSGNPVTGVPCNTTGVFTNIPFGSYCLQVTDQCSGQTVTKCFTVNATVPSVGPVTISNISCTGFTATVSNQQNLTNPTFCLFDSLNNAVGACNSTGVFAITGFGPYTIKTTDGCAGTVLTSTFSYYHPVPSVGAIVNFSNQDCNTFSAAITGQSNLVSPLYNLKDGSGNVIRSNTTGIFDTIPYGSYCIDVVNGCGDTTITRCFTQAPNNVTAVVTTTPSCTLNRTDFTVDITAGYGPFKIEVYDLLYRRPISVTISSTHYVLNGTQYLNPGQTYYVIVTGACGGSYIDTVLIAGSSLSHNYNIVQKCPSSLTQSGSADLIITAVTNLTLSGITLISKDGAPVNISYSNKTGNDYTYSNLDPATYVIKYAFSGCGTILYDTLLVPTYSFPDLAKSAAYQCDNNSFSVGAAVNGGVGPYMYEIIGSTPSSPAIVAAPQSNPVFTINNNTQYSLVRLRAIDACGNAGLNDASILPLANTIITASSDCIYQSTTLTTDAVPNATYNWYKKTSATDSVLIGTGNSYYIPFLDVSDTGTYVNHMSVNSGCLTKLSYFHLDGTCGGMIILPNGVKLTGRMVSASSALLQWNASNESHTTGYILERSENNTNHFVAIGTVNAGSASATGIYGFTDNEVSAPINYYRLKVIADNGGSKYTNVVTLKGNGDGLINIYPNPADNVVHININSNTEQRYSVSLFNIAGQQLYNGAPITMRSGVVDYNRDGSIPSGVYFLKVTNISNGVVSTFKITFK